MSRKNPIWIAQRHNQDWRDEETLNVIDWFTSIVNSSEWTHRMDVVRENFEAGKKEWAVGNRIQLFDPKDAIAWYIFQAQAGAAKREDWYEPDAFRISPIFNRLGKIITDLQGISGIEDRIQTLLTRGKSQPDDGLFELLVAGAYKRRNWTNVAFVPERPGVSKSQDLLVSAGRRHWAVECKRAGRSSYEASETERANALIKPVHELCRKKGKSIIVQVIFNTELSDVDGDYLVEKAEDFIDNSSCCFWNDHYGKVHMAYVDWSLARAVLAHDDVFYGSSRMAELLTGQYSPQMDYSIVADWVPAPKRPLHATSLSRASVVSWASRSFEAAERKASHFKSVVGKASKQLPGDLPGAIHVGYEAKSATSVDDLRHVFNSMMIKDFDPEKSRLRWVYGSYLSPEHTNDRNESWAISETTAQYKIGHHRTNEPLPNHLLFNDGAGKPGHHW